MRCQVGLSKEFAPTNGASKVLWTVVREKVLRHVHMLREFHFTNFTFKLRLTVGSHVFHQPKCWHFKGFQIFEWNACPGESNYRCVPTTPAHFYAMLKPLLTLPDVGGGALWPPWLETAGIQNLI